MLTTEQIQEILETESIWAKPDEHMIVHDNIDVPWKLISLDKRTGMPVGVVQQMQEAFERMTNKEDDHG
jgi:hypothetical protein